MIVPNSDTFHDAFRHMVIACPCTVGTTSVYADESGLRAQEEMSKFRDLEYCKVDLIAAKGIVFVKYAKSSSALLALESILANDCMVRTFIPNAYVMHRRSLPLISATYHPSPRMPATFGSVL